MQEVGLCWEGKGDPSHNYEGTLIIDGNSFGDQAEK